MMHLANVDAEQIAALAKAADVDERTLMRFLAGAKVWPKTKRAIEAAMKKRKPK